MAASSNHSSEETWAAAQSDKWTWCSRSCSGKASWYSYNSYIFRYIVYFTSFFPFILISPDGRKPTYAHANENCYEGLDVFQGDGIMRQLMDPCVVPGALCPPCTALCNAESPCGWAIGYCHQRAGGSTRLESIHSSELLLQGYLWKRMDHSLKWNCWSSIQGHQKRRGHRRSCCCLNSLYCCQRGCCWLW